MYDTVIVPLDGSYQAELALPTAVEEARRYRAALVLVHVTPCPGLLNSPMRDHHPRADGDRALGEDLRAAIHLGRLYLDHVGKRRGLPSWTTTTVVIGEPFNQILSVAGRLARPLIVVALADAADVACPSIGDVAKRLLAESSVPTLGVQSMQAR